VPGGAAYSRGAPERMFKRSDLRLPPSDPAVAPGPGMGDGDPTSAPRPHPVGHLTDLSRLPIRDRDGRLLMVVEAPAGSRLKLKYDPRLGAFTISRPLVLGLAYPFDWGFIPSTRASDGDALDCMALGDAPTYPGVLIPCRAIGLARYTQDDPEGGKQAARQRNDRVIAVPVDAPRWDQLTDARKLPTRIREEIEAFFACAVLLEDKGLRFEGWDGPKAADKAIREATLR